MFKFFDKLEDRVRGRLSKTPILYAIIGGVAIVFFWRGVWDYADIIESRGGILALVFSPFGSIVISVSLLLVTGLFVSFFIGDRIILSGLRHEKKIEEKTESEVREEEETLAKVERKIDRLEKEIGTLAELIRNGK